MGEKWSEPEYDYTLPQSAEVHNGRSCTFIFSICFHRASLSTGTTLPFITRIEDEITKIGNIPNLIMKSSSTGLAGKLSCILEGLQILANFL
jgi:hypothetical protein